MTLFEDRSTYDEKSDFVCHLSVSVQCNPGQLASVIDFISGLSKQAGIYSIDLTSEMKPPESWSANGEQPLEQTNSDSPGEPVGGQGSVPAEGKPTEVEPEHVEPELAGPAGKVGTGSE